MSISKKIDTILAAFGNMKAMQRLHVDTFTENKIANIQGKKIAESTDGQLWIRFDEIDNYLFLEVVTVTKINLKTFKGCSIHFIKNSKMTSIASDTQEIESDFSNVSNSFLTEISFIITPEELKLIESNLFDSIEIKFKKKHLKFDKSV